MASSPESKTLLSCYKELIVVIRNNLEAIARFLRIEDIISHEMYREVTDGCFTDDKRARIMLRCLEDKVQEDVRYYSIFYDYLSKEQHSNMISQMNEEIVRFRNNRSKYIVVAINLSFCEKFNYTFIKIYFNKESIQCGICGVVTTPSKTLNS